VAVDLAESPVAFLLLAERVVGESAAAVDIVMYGRPDVYLLGGPVPGLSHMGRRKASCEIGPGRGPRR
jgi:hypothetical protein